MSLMRWVINFFVGVYVAVIAVLVAVAITWISRAKFMAVYACILALLFKSATYKKMLIISQ